MSHVRPILLAILLAACSRTARPVATAPEPLFIPPLARRTGPADPLSVRFGEGAAAPSGCFAVSRRTGAVACVLGQYAVASDAGGRHLSLLQSSDEGVPDVPVRVQKAQGGVKLESDSQRTLDALMREGDFVALGAPVMLSLDAPRSFGGLTVELRRGPTLLVEGLSPSAQLFDVEVIVRLEGRGEANAEDVLLANTLTSVACRAPSLAVRVLEPTIVLLERECRLDDVGEPEVLVAAWLCDSERARCD